jgi:hypothetical protein
MRRNFGMVSWNVAVIQLLYYPQCWLKGLRNAAAVMGAEHGFFFRPYINFYDSKFVWAGPRDRAV